MRIRLFILFIILLQILVQGCSTNNKKDLQLSTSVSPSEAGTVNPQKGHFSEGESLEISAIPNEDWVFDRWKGDLTGTANPSTLIVNKNLDITAMFMERTYPLNLEILGEGTVSEQIIQQKSTEYSSGTVVELTATPAENWHFKGWSGDLGGTEPQQQITITEETNVTATFSNDFVKTFGGSGGDEAWAVDFTADGGLILAGRSTSNDGDFEGLARGEYYFPFVLKLSASGEKEWGRTFYGNDLYERAASVIQTQDGGYLFTGQTFPDKSESENVGQGEISVVKLNSMGDTEWSKIFGGSNSDYPREIVETSNGDFMIVGSTGSDDGDFEGLQHGQIDGFIIKLTSDGNTKWIKTYGGNDLDSIHSIALTTDNGVVVTGTTESEDGDFGNTTGGLDDVFAMKLNLDGEIIWTKIFGRGSDYYTNKTNASKIITSSDGGYIITGSTSAWDGDFTGINNSFIKPYVIKLDPSGEKEWTTVYEGNFSIMRVYSVAEIQNGNIFVTGYSNSNTEIYHPQINIDAQIMALKLNSSGSVQWFKTFGGSEDEFGYSMITSNNNSIVITGQSSSADGLFSGLNRGNSHIYVIKLNESGELIPFE